MTSVVIPFGRKPSLSSSKQTATNTDFAAMYAGFFTVAVRTGLISPKELKGIARGAQSVIDLMTPEAS